MKDYSIDETCDLLGVTRQALYQAMQKGKLKSSKIDGRHRITSDAIKEFRQNRYSRAHHFEEGIISTKQAAVQGKVNIQRIYYMIYYYMLPATQLGSMWFIKQSDLERCNLAQRVKRGQRKK